MSARKLCPEHAQEWGSWLDYRLPPAPVQLIQIAGTSPARMQEAREARFRRWRDTIRSQQDLIRQACSDQCQD